MVTRGDPSPLRWLIGVELAGYRNAAGLSLAAASELVGMSKAKLGHMETGRQQQDPDDIARLLTAYQATQRDIDRLMSLTGRADDATWSSASAHIVPDWLKTFVGLERIAEREFVFEPILISGLLQTEDYARAVTAGSPRVRPDETDRVVDFRLARAERLIDPDKPLHLHAVMTEAALRLAVGTPEIRRAQLEHLIAMSEQPNVTVQVIRPEDGKHSASTGQFVVLDFEDVRSIAYVELHNGAVYIQDPEHVRGYTLVDRNLQEVALDPNRTKALIKSMIER